MSIVIKGIDMPKEGEKHQITIYDNGNTYITTSNIFYETDRKDVAAIQIPKTIICENLLRDIEYEVHKDEFDY